jgi:hypothetical protein
MKSKQSRRKQTYIQFLLKVKITLFYAYNKNLYFFWGKVGGEKNQQLNKYYLF